MAVVMATRLSTGALALTRQTFLQGEPDSHWSWLSVRGTEGLAESLRAPGRDAWSVRLRNEPWAHGGSLRDEVRVPESLQLYGEAVDPMEAGTARVVEAFWRTVTEGRRRGCRYAPRSRPPWSASPERTRWRRARVRWRCRTWPGGEPRG